MSEDADAGAFSARKYACTGHQTPSLGIGKHRHQLGVGAPHRVENVRDHRRLGGIRRRYVEFTRHDDNYSVSRGRPARSGPMMEPNFQETPTLPLTFKRPAKKAAAGLFFPDEILQKSSNLTCTVVSALPSSFVTRFGTDTASIKILPTSPKSNFTV